MTDGGLEAVFMRHRVALRRFLAARGGADDADDLVQELWVRIIGARTGPITEPLRYLYRMADNLVLDRRRADQRRGRRDGQWAADAAEDLAGISSEPTIDRVLIAREGLAWVQRVLDSLGERTALIVRRYRIDGASQRDVANELGISLSAVEKHLQKAYHALVEARSELDADSPPLRRREIEGVNDVAR